MARLTGKKRMAVLHTFPCQICGFPPAANNLHNRITVHHTHTYMGGRKDDHKTVTLCHKHHQGEQGIHKLRRRKFAEMFGVTEDDLLEQANKRLRAAGYEVQEEE